jgi:hypothetical protein
LCLGGLAVEVDGHRLTMEGAPRLDIDPVDGHRVGHENLGRNGGARQSGGEPLGVDPSSAGLEHLAQLHKESLDPGIGLGRIPTVDTETLALFIAQGIQCPGYFDQVGLMVPVKGIELTCD